MDRNMRHEQHITVDLGPTTLILLSELILIVLKLMNYIVYSWTLILSPVILVITGAALILLFTLFKMLRKHLF
jgi:uncharacterized membrane protein